MGNQVNKQRDSVYESDQSDQSINIGITGQSHRGKSSFINAVRGVKPGDLGAAAVKNRECTMELTPYEFVHNANIILWDLPGVGTNTFPKETYLEEIQFTRY